MNIKVTVVCGWWVDSVVHQEAGFRTVEAPRTRNVRAETIFVTCKGEGGFARHCTERPRVTYN